MCLSDDDGAVFPLLDDSRVVERRDENFGASGFHFQTIPDIFSSKGWAVRVMVVDGLSVRNVQGDHFGGVVGLKTV